MRLLTGLQRQRPPEGGDVVALGPISLRVHRPPSSAVGPRPGLLWIHGGGFVIGQAVQDDAICRHVATELGAVVVAVDYRLAPEHPFPIPLDDCHDGLVWLSRHPDVDEARVAIGGASAGGGLAAALALLARDRGEVDPLLQLLSYPMLDDRTALRNDLDERHVRLWNNKANRFGWASYLGTDPGGDDISGLAAPARHPDLAGVAPAWLGVGTLDLFLDEDLAYAERLRAAGVPCEVDLVDGAFHGFDRVAAKAPVTLRFWSAQLAALSSAWT